MDLASEEDPSSLSPLRVSFTGRTTRVDTGSMNFPTHNGYGFRRCCFVFGGTLLAVVAAERKKEKVWLAAKPLSRSNQVTDETLAELIIVIIIHGRSHLHYSRK